MSKRYTDAKKWRKDWFVNLSVPEKLLWIYVTDNCDHAGICDFSEKVFSFELGFKVTKESISRILIKKIIWVEYNKFYIVGFTDFQQCKELKPQNRVHASIIKRLEPYMTLISSMLGSNGEEVQLNLDGSTPDSKKHSHHKETHDYNSDAVKVLEHLNNEAKKSYPITPTTKKPIMARLKEGFTPDDCINVINDRVKRWKGDDKMDEFLRPETLFGKTNFPGYLGNIKKVRVPKNCQCGKSASHSWRGKELCDECMIKIIDGQKNRENQQKTEISRGNGQ